MFYISAVGSLIIGCLGAFVQRTIKRFLAYTTINNIGFILLGITAGAYTKNIEVTIQSFAITIYYLILYLFLTTLIFGILLNIIPVQRKTQYKSRTLLLYMTDLVFLRKLVSGFLYPRIG